MSMTISFVCFNLEICHLLQKWIQQNKKGFKDVSKIATHTHTQMMYENIKLKIAMDNVVVRRLMNEIIITPKQGSKYK